MYFATAESLSPTRRASGCSGATTTYVAPISVSARVVKTRTSSPPPSVAKAISAPSDLPIHDRCIVIVPSGQSSPSSSAASRSASAVILSTHCRSGLRSTGKPPRSERPSMISSLASTVPRPAHQLTGFSSWKARPCSKSLRKIHCVHLTYPTSVVASSRSQSYEKPSERSCRLKFAMFSLVVTSGCVPVFIACCSAGRPNESHPIGCSTS
mmetsp:Transcript_864/g.2617  ORF Transcript_864/g.2617 Transcript_864/m.2617 type:complete len:211 (-) Transcript_864:471-1103(-)